MAAKYRTKPIRQLFHLKDFTPDGEGVWKAETLVGFEPAVHGVTLLENDDLILELTENKIASVTTMAKIVVFVAYPGIKPEGLNWAGHITRTYKTGLMGEQSTVELDVWTDVPVIQL